MKIDLNSNLKLYWPIAALLFVFVLMTFGFWGQAPDLDALINYRESVVMCDSGIGGLLRARGGSMHPPLLYALNCPAFLIFQKSPFATNVVGLVIYAGIVSFSFLLAKMFFQYRTAVFTTFLIGLSPFTIVHSFYPMSESLMFCVLLACFYFYAKEHFFKLSVSLGLFVLMKQTSLVFIATFALFLFVKNMREKQKLKSTSLFLFKIFTFPVLCFAGWKVTLLAFGGGEWNSQIQNGASGSPFAALLQVFSSFSFPNVYFNQNLENAFVYHFAWVFSGLALVCLFLIKKYGSNFSRKARELLWLGFFCLIAYSLFVFSFPTWTIPRYALPAHLLVLFFVGVCVVEFFPKQMLKPVCIGLLSVQLLANYVSADPVTRRLTGPYFTQVSEQLYDSAYTWRGADRAAYNLQFAQMSSLQNDWIEKAIAYKVDVFIADRFDFKLGEKLWSAQAFSDAFPQFSFSRPIDCIHPKDVNVNFASRIMNKRAFVSNRVPLSALNYFDVQVVGIIDREKNTLTERNVVASHR